MPEFIAGAEVLSVVDELVSIVEEEGEALVWLVVSVGGVVAAGAACPESAGGAES